MVIVRSSFPFLQLAHQASVHRLLFPPQLLHQAASVPTDLVAAPASLSVKAQHSVTAVALRGSAALPLVIVKPAVKRPLVRAQKPVCLLTGHVEAPTNTSARDLDTEIAAVPADTVDRLLATALQGARLSLGPVRPPISRRMGLAEEPRVICAKALPSEIAVANLVIVVLLPHTVLPAARQRLAHALRLTSHLMARVAGRRSTSARAPATVIAAVLADIVANPQIIAVQAVNLVSVPALRWSRPQRHLSQLGFRRMAVVVEQRD